MRRRVRRLDVEERDRRARRRQRVRVLPSEASRAAGDDRDVALERKEHSRGGPGRHSRVACACRRVVRRLPSASRASSRA